MHPIWQFIIIISVIVVSGVFGGLKLVAFMNNREEEVKNLYLAIAFILGGFIVATGYFLAVNPEGKTEVVLPKDGGYKLNENAPQEPSRQELVEDSKQKKTKEWGQVNDKSYDEIRNESNEMVENSIKENNK